MNSYKFTYEIFEYRKIKRTIMQWLLDKEPKTETIARKEEHFFRSNRTLEELTEAIETLQFHSPTLVRVGEVFSIDDSLLKNNWILK